MPPKSLYAAPITNRYDQTVWVTAVDLLRIPDSNSVFTVWLQQLRQSCEQYVASYESSPSQVVFAVGLIQNHTVEFVRQVHRSAPSTAGLPGNIPSSYEVAEAIYLHCRRLTGRAPGDTTFSSMPHEKMVVAPSRVSMLSKPAGAVALPGGLDLVSLLLGAAVGGIGMHFYAKR
jgi:hypothetical protein